MTCSDESASFGGAPRPPSARPAAGSCDPTPRVPAGEGHREPAALSVAIDEAAMAALPDLIFRLRRDGTYLGFRAPGGARLLLPPERFIGRNVRDVLPTLAPALLACIERAAASGGEEWHEYVVLREDGPRTKEVRVVAVGEDEALAVVRDVTSRKRAEEECAALRARLAEAQRLESLSALAGGVAHEFNSLLVGILGNASLALREAAPESRLAEILRRVQSSAQRAAHLTDQLLSFAGPRRYLVERVGLQQIVEASLPVLRRGLPAGTTLSTAHSESPPIAADAAQVRGLLTALVRHAAETQAGRPETLTIRTGSIDVDAALLPHVRLGEALSPGLYTFIEVAGAGAPGAGGRGHTFEPVFSGSVESRTLGLASVVGIIRQHGGGILLDSAPGTAPSVMVLFPAAQEHAVAGPVRGAGSPPQDLLRVGPAAQTILVIDDEPLVREVTTNALTQAGFRVVGAASGSAAIDLLESRGDDIAAALLDYQMPREGAGAVLSRLRAIRPGLPVVLMSGHPREALDAVQLRGVSGFIQKPFAIEGLIGAVRRALGCGEEADVGRGAGAASSAGEERR